MGISGVFYFLKSVYSRSQVSLRSQSYDQEYAWHEIKSPTFDKLYPLRAVFNWAWKTIWRLLWFGIATLCDWLKNLAPLFRLIEVKLKPIVILLHAFSRALRHLLTMRSYWFIGFSASVVIGQSDYSGFYDNYLKAGLSASSFITMNQSFDLSSNILFNKNSTVSTPGPVFKSNSWRGGWDNNSGQMPQVCTASAPRAKHKFINNLHGLKAITDSLKEIFRYDHEITNVTTLSV